MFVRSSFSCFFLHYRLGCDTFAMRKIRPMKKIFIVLLLLMSTTISFADKKEVDITTEEDKRPRSIVQKPTVFVDDVMNTLSVKFTSQGEVYIITITDGTGFPIAQFQIVSDYGQQVYSLPVMTSGSYNITIEGRSSFTGSFDI